MTQPHPLRRPVNKGKAMLKSISNLVLVGIMSGLAAAQTTNPAPANPPAANPTAATKAKAKVPAKPTTAAKPTTPAKPAAASKPANKATTAAKKTTPPPAAKPAPKKPEVKVAEKPKPSPTKKAADDEKLKTVAMDPHRRDPFVNPLQLQEDRMKNTAACTTGARCLMIDQVVLKGVVKTQEGMIAMVENSAKKQYNLREKDPVYNGFVLKITGDTIVFKETTVDTLGKSTSKEVVKRVTVPAV